MKPERAFGEGLLRLAMLSHPLKFRREYRDEMLEYYRETLRREGRGRSWRWRARFLAVSIAAAVREGLEQRRALRRPPSPAPPRRGRSPLTGLPLDIRQAWRRVVAHPVASGLAAGMLALAIGVTTAMFTVVDALLLRPVPFVNADRIAHVVVRTDRTVLVNVPRPVLRAWRTSGLFERVEGAHTATSVVDLPPTVTEREGAFVTPGLLDMLGVRPLYGRLFVGGEGSAGADEAVILAERFWRSAFASDASLIGHRVHIDGRPLLVIGVLPDSFRFPQWNTELWRPMDYDVPPPAQARASPTVYVLFRSAAPRDEALGRALQVAWDVAPGLLKRPGMGPSTRADVRPIAGLDGGAYLAQAMPFLAGAGVLVFLVLSANVASLLLARIGGRAREFALCAALGASRARLLRQAFAEALVIGAAGIAAGVGTAAALVGAVRRWLPDAFLMQTLNPIDLDSRALALASVAGVVATVAVATLPAWVGTRAGATAAHAGREPRGGTESRLARACSRILLVTEIALGTALLAGTTLLVASFVRLADVDRGLDTRGVVTAWVAPPEGQSVGAIEQAIRRLPGVTATTTSSQRFTHYGDGFVPDTPGATPVEIWTSAQSVGPDYFSFYGIRLMHGRVFEPSEGPPNVIVSERFAEAMWPGLSAVGRSFRFYDDRYTVIGVAKETRFPSLDRRRDLAELYLPHPSRRPTAMVSIRCEVGCGNPAQLRRQITSLVPGTEIHRVEVLDERFDGELARPRAAATLAVVFAGIAVLAAAGGLFSVLSYAVGRRRREFGIRASLGARPIELQKLVFREGVQLALAGLVAGGIGAWALAKALASVVYEVSAAEPFITIVVGGVIGGTTILASWIPARRAASPDPSVLLRES
jgi:predicted permease